MKRLDNVLVIVSLVLLAIVLASMPARATTPKIPNYFRTSENAAAATYAPCRMVPYTPWTNPGNARLGSSALMYYAFDGTPDFVNPAAKGGSVFATNGGGTHSLVINGFDGYVYPVTSGLNPPKPFPAPPASAGLCTSLGGPYSNACPSDDAAYPALIGRTSDWLDGTKAEQTYGHYQEDCNGILPTPVVTGAPPPAKTATPLCCTVCPPGQPIPPCASPTRGRTATATRSPLPPVKSSTPPPKPSATPVPSATRAPLPPTPLATATAAPKPWLAGCVAAHPTPVP